MLDVGDWVYNLPPWEICIRFTPVPAFARVDRRTLDGCVDVFVAPSSIVGEESFVTMGESRWMLLLSLVDIMEDSSMSGVPPAGGSE